MDAATSDELRILRAHIGLGKAGTKEANEVLIYEHIEKHPIASGVDSSQVSDLGDEFADSVHALPPVPAMPSFGNVPGVGISDPVQEDDPWRKFIGTPMKSHRGQGVHSDRSARTATTSQPF